MLFNFLVNFFCFKSFFNYKQVIPAHVFHKIPLWTSFSSKSLQLSYFLFVRRTSDKSDYFDSHSIRFVYDKILNFIKNKIIMLIINFTSVSLLLYIHPSSILHSLNSQKCITSFVIQYSLKFGHYLIRSIHL